jgi:uncharacterized membrane protein
MQILVFPTASAYICKKTIMEKSKKTWKKPAIDESERLVENAVVGGLTDGTDFTSTQAN